MASIEKDVEHEGGRSPRKQEMRTLQLAQNGPTVHLKTQFFTRLERDVVNKTTPTTSTLSSTRRVPPRITQGTKNTENNHRVCKRTQVWHVQLVGRLRRVHSSSTEMNGGTCLATRTLSLSGEEPNIIIPEPIN